MPWFAAHVIMSVRFKDGKQDTYPVWENVVLVEAATDKEAWHKAERRARDDEGDSEGSFTWAGRPATWVFAGIRKLIMTDYLGAPPASGSEVTYSEFELATAEDLRKLVDGESVDVIYVEQPPRM
jgi:hypothetical protein